MKLYSSISTLLKRSIIRRSLRRKHQLALLVFVLLVIYLLIGSGRTSTPIRALRQLAFHGRYSAGQENGTDPHSQHLSALFSQANLNVVFPPLPDIPADHVTYDNAADFACLHKDPVHKKSFELEDVWCKKRPSPMAQYKNPCHQSGPPDQPKLKCLPYFHVLGFDKCGTTDFFERLAHHPHVALNNGWSGKETYFWCYKRKAVYMTKRTSKKWVIVQYYKYFKSAALRISEEHRIHTIVGDGTPMDVWDFRFWEEDPHNSGLSEPLVVTPHYMRHLYTQPRFIVLLREPVERLYSDYIFLGYGSSPEEFARDAVRSVEMMRECLVYNSTRRCFYSHELYRKLPTRIHIGCYSVFIREYLSVFHRSHFLFLQSEDFHDNMEERFQDVFKFLTLAPLNSTGMSSLLHTDISHQTKRKTKLGKMTAETRRILREFYAPFNQDLAWLLQDQNYLWAGDG